MYKIKADMHTHTVASAHAFSTINEMITFAKKQDLEMIAITEHGVGMLDSPHPWYFNSVISSIPPKVDGVLFVPGVEANIMDYEGTLDMPAETLKKLRWVIASYHDDCAKPGTVEEHTKSYLEIAKNPFVDVIGHCGTDEFRFDYERCIKEFKKHNKIVEINNHSSEARRGSEKNCREIALLCKKYEVPVILSSDAHSCYNVGIVSLASALLESIDFPRELILNLSCDRIIEHIKTKKGIDYSKYK